MREADRYRTSVAGLLIASLFMGSSGSASESVPAEGVKTVRAGSKVSIEYTLSLDDGSVLDSTVGDEPVQFEQGSKQVIVGLNEALIGMKLDEQKRVTVPPEKGYGEKDPLAFRPIPLEKIPLEARVPGTELGTEDEQGRPILMRVERIEGDQAILDFNHPLAGLTLVFDLKVVAID
jgi:FKBP-type peptidyl-prolyl cis-trans isomerase 2